tara:strand:+ start:724 stop:1140 length:417 start_codon:yes stop_codon:yes gene_type:complete
MKLYNIYGRITSKNVTKYLIKWDAKSRSKLQAEVKKFLKTYWQNQSVYEEFPVYGTRMKVDFLNATKKIAIEVNGPQHDKFNKFFHNNSRADYLKHIKRDLEKVQWLELNNFKIIELNTDDVKNISYDFIKSNFDVNI